MTFRQILREYYPYRNNKGKPIVPYEDYKLLIAEEKYKKSGEQDARKWTIKSLTTLD